MIDAKDVEKEPATCPFSKSSKLKSSKKTPCPVINALINAGELDPNKVWSRQELISVLKTNNIMSDSLSRILTYAQSYPNQWLWFPGISYLPSIKKPTSFSVKTLQKHNFLEHDVSISREDFHLGNHIDYNDKRFKLIYKYFKNQKSISLRELIEYINYLYKKSKKENNNLTFGLSQWLMIIIEMNIIFILLSENGRLNLKKLEKVFKKESLEGIETTFITLQLFFMNMIKSIKYWTTIQIKNTL
jgi:hypothetical protein